MGFGDLPQLSFSSVGGIDGFFLFLSYYGFCRRFLTFFSCGFACSLGLCPTNASLSWWALWTFPTFLLSTWWNCRIIFIFIFLYLSAGFTATSDFFPPFCIRVDLSVRGDFVDLAPLILRLPCWYCGRSPLSFSFLVGFVDLFLLLRFGWGKAVVALSLSSVHA